MAEHTVPYSELEDFKPPKGEEVVSFDPDQNGAWLVVTAPVEKPKAK
jgi:hypothetical protein